MSKVAVPKRHHRCPGCGLSLAVTDEELQRGTRHCTICQLWKPIGPYQRTRTVHIPESRTRE